MTKSISLDDLARQLAALSETVERLAERRPGRKRGAPKVQLNVKVTATCKERLEAMAQAREMGMGELVEDMIEKAALP